MDPNQQPSAAPPTSLLSPVAPAPQPPATAEDPGRTLAIIGLVVGFIANPAFGFPICYVAKKKSQDAGFHNKIAIVGMWIFGVIIVLAVLAFIALALLLAFGPKH